MDLLLRGEKGRKIEGGGKERNGMEGENDLTHPLSQIPGYATVRANRNIMTKGQRMLKIYFRKTL